MSDWLLWLKTALLTLAMFAINLGASIEPDKAIWAMAFGGSLGGVAIGVDRKPTVMAVHWFIGMLVGVAASPYINSALNIPKPLAALLSAILGTKAILSIWNRIDVEGVGWLFPWGRRP